MKKFLLVLTLLLSFNPVYAINNLAANNEIQTKIDNVGVRLLNFNKIQKRIVFVYDEEDKKDLIASKSVTERQVIVYGTAYKSVQTDDELAAMLAREISSAIKSYSGMWSGRLDTIQVILGSKKFETVADKRAVDYMVKAGYNPL